MQLHSGRPVDLIPAAAQAALMLGLAAKEPALGLLFGVSALGAVVMAWALAQNPPTHPSLSPWAVR
jgi:hypothetical protein